MRYFFFKLRLVTCKGKSCSACLRNSFRSLGAVGVISPLSAPLRPTGSMGRLSPRPQTPCGFRGCFTDQGVPCLYVYGRAALPERRKNPGEAPGFSLDWITKTQL